VLLIWPEGIVYGCVTAERIERIVHEHVIGGQPIEPWIVQRQPFQGLSQALEPQPAAP
jgi:(2Fe-2S) ferredoxin